MKTKIRLVKRTYDQEQESTGDISGLNFPVKSIPSQYNAELVNYNARKVPRKIYSPSKNDW